MIAIYSRRTFLYGILAVRCAIEYDTETYQYIGGFELGSGHNIPLASLFRWKAVQTTLRISGADFIELKLDNILPSDFKTEVHRYVLKVNKSNVELFCDGNLVGICLLGVPESIPKWENNPPYALGGYKEGIVGACPTLIEPSNQSNKEKVFPPQLGNSFIATDGDPLPPRQYALYNENTSTKWNGQSTGVAITSHPIPVWGYGTKTLFFQSDAAGELDIQVYAGGAWRTYEKFTVTANTLEVRTLTAEVPIVRCVYTPAGTDTIAVGEFYVS
jgi:hypothetical protein